MIIPFIYGCLSFEIAHFFKVLLLRFHKTDSADVRGTVLLIENDTVQYSYIGRVLRISIERF